MYESGCKRSVNVRAPRTESIPFSSIPAQNKLFLDYLNSPLSLKHFYPSAVAEFAALAGRADAVISNHATNRARLCSGLERTNRPLRATPETIANINLLEQPDSVAVLTGQQTGLFTGPLYSIYKALTAITGAECLRGQGIKAVPVFWMATEDHDLAEVSSAFVVGNDGRLVESNAVSSIEDHGRSVGNVRFDRSIEREIRNLFSSLPKTEFSNDVHALIKDCWHAGQGFGEAFGSMLTRLLGKYGLVIVDPLEPEIKQLAVPLYLQAIDASEQIESALIERSADIEGAGYSAQVLIEKGHVPMFWQNNEGKRIALRTGTDGLFRPKGEKEAFTKSELLAMIKAGPSDFSPSVMLRPVVQDFLFPTIAYFGGGAEIAYFAQNSEVYRILGRPVTPILHRQSFTIIEPRHERTIEKYQLSFDSLFAGRAEVLPSITDQILDPATAKLFADVEEKINTELNRLDQALSQMDITLAENLATRRRKIIYHIGALRKKYQLRRIVLDDDLNRRLNDLFDSLLPNGHLQERTLNVVSFLDRYGEAFIDQVYSAADLNDSGHRLIYL